jgi:hypothetical protein
MELHRLLDDEQLLRDLGIRQAARHELEDTPLRRCEHRILTPLRPHPRLSPDRPRGPERDATNDGRALAEARLEVERREWELAVRSGSRSVHEARFLVQRLELARKRVQRLLAGPTATELLMLAVPASTRPPRHGPAHSSQRSAVRYRSPGWKRSAAAPPALDDERTHSDDPAYGFRKLVDVAQARARHRGERRDHGRPGR